MARGVHPLLIVLVFCGYGCNERGATVSSEGGADGGETESAESTASSSTGDSPTACGEDGIAVGVFLIRENSDAAALRGCHTVDGDVIIDPCRTCADPSRVDCTDCVEASMLTSIEGLESLRDVTGSLAVGWDRNFRKDDDEWSGPVALTSLEPLSQLERVGGFFWLGAAPVVEEAAFPNLVSVGGELRVSNAFSADAAFPTLQHAGQVSFSGTARQSLELPRLATVDGGVWLLATSVSDLGGLPRLESVSGTLALHDNVLLDSLPWSELPNVRSFHLLGSPAVTFVNLAAFKPLSARIEGNLALTDVDGRGLETMDGLNLIDLPLTEADFGDLRSVQYDLFIRDTSLPTLDGFANLERVDGRLWITDNPNLCQSEVDAFIERVELKVAFMSDGNADC